MDDLFRFIALRAPDEADPTQAINLTHRDDFQHDLAGIHPPPSAPAPPAPPTPIPPFIPHPLETALRICESYMNGGYGGGFIRDPSTLPLARNFDDFFKAISSGGQIQNLHDLGVQIKNAFQKNATAVVADPEFQRETINIGNSIIAVFIRPIMQGNPIEKLTRLARLVNLIGRIAERCRRPAIGIVQDSVTAPFDLPNPPRPAEAGGGW